MPRVLLIDSIPLLLPLAERFGLALPEGVTFDVVPSSSEEDLAQRAAEADILLVLGRQVDAHLLALAPRVRFIQKLGVGYDNLDLAALSAAGVVAAYTPGANAQAVAEHTILLMLALVKRFVAAETAVRQGGWQTQELVRAGLGDLATAAVGLIGFGNIGRAVAQRLQPFGARVLYTARHAVDSALEAQLGVHFIATLDDLLAACDIISLHLPLSDATHGLLGEAEFARMRAGALLINTARGDLVDESALRRALESGHLGGAGLDVLRNERPGGNPFADLPQVIVTPHIAGASRAALAQLLRMAIANIERFLRGESPLDLVPLPSAS
ncbi:MAG: 2-hydroxyacid dehydrogenase [Chloroflexota bacterium]|nr:2-hydroxyacid dehydrogenase [Chloroflexota bacterium]